MKSSEEQLAKRGYANTEKIQALQDCSLDALIILLHSNNASERSAATYALQRFPLTKQLANILLEQLQHEPCLYTRLAISQSLAKGNQEIAIAMSAYLGKINHNQHTHVAKLPSKKTSYPLARDCIARCLATMSPTIMPVLVSVLKSQDTIAIREVIDAIGYLAFYHQEVATKELLTTLIETLHMYQTDSLIVWKLLICFSAFCFDESKAILSAYTNDQLFGKEALRSLQLIAKRN